jgi:excisionase family DNA binding protein
MTDLASTGQQVVFGPQGNGSNCLLDAKGAGRLLSVPASWVLAEARADRIPHVRFGRYVRFDRETLLAWTAERARGPRPKRTAGYQPAAPGRDAQ